MGSARSPAEPVGRASRVQLMNPWFVESLGSITPSFALPAKEPRTNEHQSESQTDEERQMQCPPRSMITVWHHDACKRFAPSQDWF